jgi:Tol biopolymer transport system component
MNRPMSVESLRLILDELAGTGRSDYVAETVARSASVRQRPAWSIAGNWLPRFLVTRTDPVKLAPARPAILVLTAVLLIAALLAAAIVGSRPRVPPPFGPAANGAITFVRAGDIYVADAIDAAPRLLIAGGDGDGIPIYSPQGDRLAFLRTPASDPDGGSFVLMLADIDGSNARELSGLTSGLNGIAWSPDGSTIMFGQSIASVSALVGYRVADGSSTVLDLGVPAEWPAWRPPDGRQLAFLGLVNGQWELHIANAEGGDVHRLGIAGDRPGWSPDGTRLVFSHDGRTHVAEMDASGMVTAVRTLAFDAASDLETGAIWSPDGARLAFIRASGGQFVVAVGDADGGAYRDVGIAGPEDQSVNSVWMWSPDGRSILQTFDDGPTWLLDPDGGKPRRTDFGTSAFSNWQRLAP